jgi:hypothetical protein
MNEPTKAREIADAILIVIRTLAKWIAIVLFAIVGLVAAFLAYDHFTNERERQQREEVLIALKRGVKVSAAFDPQSCFSQQPFKIEFQNNTKTSIDHIGFKLYVTRKGHSTVLNSEYSTYKSDFILQPGETTTGCWQVDNNQNYKPLVAADGPLEVRIELTDIKPSE